MRSTLIPGGNFLLAVAAAVLLALPAYGLRVYRLSIRPPEVARVADQYLKAIYARDFRRAYRWISTRDRRTKDQATYVKERGAFTGFTSRLAAKLAGFIESTPTKMTLTDRHATIRLQLRVPDADSLSPQLLEWDEDRLNSLAAKEQTALLEMLDRWHREAKMPFAQTEETFELVRENLSWRILLNWKRTVRVQILTRVPRSEPLEVEPAPQEIVFQPGEPFTVTLRLKNRSNQMLRARVAHNVEPDFMAKYLGLGDCGSFVPFRLAAGKEEENSSTFLVWTDIPEQTDRFTLIYEFEVDK